MTLQTTGVHHITSIAGDAQDYYRFYTHVLGLRLVKRTVNFDDPHTYHLYVADQTGSPGTVLTSFPWGAGGKRGDVGRGQVAAISLAIPRDATRYWVERLRHHGYEPHLPTGFFDEEIIRIADPDGVIIELVAVTAPVDPADPSASPVPLDHAPQHIHSLLLHSWDPAATAQFMEEELGFHTVGEQAGRIRLQTNAGGPASQVDILSITADLPPGRFGVGTIHHVAWRAADDQQQLAWLERLRELGYNVSDVRDRQYFRSIYFREPGGIIFEIATDGPGFAIDEAPDALGTNLQLPPWYEDRRQEIEDHLPPFETN